MWALTKGSDHSSTKSPHDLYLGLYRPPQPYEQVDTTTPGLEPGWLPLATWRPTTPMSTEYNRLDLPGLPAFSD
jgi:hypothetical protein